MSRVKWKGPYIDKKILKKLNQTKKNYNNLLVSRNTEISPKFLGLTFKIHNGKKNIEVTVVDKMIGYKFGEFSATRSKFSFKKTKSKK